MNDKNQHSSVASLQEHSFSKHFPPAPATSRLMVVCRSQYTKPWSGSPRLGYPQLSCVIATRRDIFLGLFPGMFYIYCASSPNSSAVSPVISGHNGHGVRFPSPRIWWSARWSPPSPWVASSSSGPGFEHCLTKFVEGLSNCFRYPVLPSVSCPNCLSYIYCVGLFFFF